MEGALLVGLILLVGELAVRLGYNIRRAHDHERRIDALEKNHEALFLAIRELKALIVNGTTA